MMLKMQTNKNVKKMIGLITLKYKVLSKLVEGVYNTVYITFNIMSNTKITIKYNNEINEPENYNELIILTLQEY